MNFILRPICLGADLTGNQRQGALNLIVFNLPECQSRISSERTKYDNAKYMELCKVIGVDEPDLKVAVRLGNPKEGVVRPSKVVMNNKKKHRKNILDNASKLKQLPHTMLHVPEMNETNDIGDDTVIGGINSQLQPQSKLQKKLKVQKIKF